MKERRKNYSRDYKQKALELCSVLGSVQEVARELGVGAEIIYRWRREFRADSSFPFGGNGNKQLKSYNRKVTNNNSIRTGVIVNWLKQYNVREVQEMAGHRHFCSTESYRQDNLENQHKIINNFHPIS